MFKLLKEESLGIGAARLDKVDLWGNEDMDIGLFAFE